MHYEINVSLNGRHFFATHKRSITSRAELRQVYNAIKAGFKVEDGYKITVTRWEDRGYSIAEETIINNFND